MSNDRVASVDDPGVIAAFVEHTHVESQHVGKTARDIPPSSGLMTIM